MLRLFKPLFKYLIYVISIVAVITVGLAVYLVWYQPPFYFPRPTGQYAIGIKAYHWIDTKRKEPLHDDPAHPYRELMVNIWYPAQGELPEKPKTPYAQYLADYYRKRQIFVWLLSGFSRPIYSYAQPNARLTADTKQFPCTIFSHNYQGTCDSNTAQCEELASHGYVVIGISHPYAYCIIPYPDGRIADGIVSYNERVAKNIAFIEVKKHFDQEIEIWVSDVSFALDQLERLANDKNSLFFQRIDQEHIGIFGHSFGGGTAAKVCQSDPRVKIGISMDGCFFGSEIKEPFSKPFMFMHSEVTLKKNEKTMTQEEEIFKSVWLPNIEQRAKSLNNNIYTLVVKDAGHMFFSDSALLKQASLFSYFIDELKDVRIGSEVGLLDGFRATKIVNDYLVNFFDKYLKSKPSELLDSKKKRYKEIDAKQWTNIGD